MTKKEDTNKIWDRRDMDLLNNKVLGVMNQEQGSEE